MAGGGGRMYGSLARGTPFSLVNGGPMGVNSLPKTVTRQRRDCDLNPGPSAPESSTLTTRLPSHPSIYEVPLFQRSNTVALRPNTVR